MLGIIFTGGESPAPDVIKRLIETEAKVTTLFIAADSGLIAAENAGIKPDWIVGDFDSLPDTTALAAYPQVRIIRSVRDKDFSDTEIAFSLAAEKGCDNIWIIGGGGGRIDHLFAIRSMFERDIFPVRWITDTADIRCLDAGLDTEDTNLHELNRLTRIKIKVDKGVIISVFPVGAGPWDAKSEGLKWPLAGLTWDRGFFGLSNVALDGEFSIIAESGRFMVILPIN